MGLCTDGLAIIAILARIRAAKKEYEFDRALSYAVQIGLMRKFAAAAAPKDPEIPPELLKMFDLLTETTPKLSFASDAPQAEQARTICLELLDHASIKTLPEIRLGALTALARADKILYLATQDLKFGLEAEKALIQATAEAANFDDDDDIPLIRILEFAIIAIYTLIYASTDDPLYGNKLESAYLTLERKNGPNIELGLLNTIHYGLGNLRLRMFRSSGDTVHAQEAEIRLRKAMATASSLEGFAEWHGTALARRDLTRLYHLLFARTGEASYEQQSAKMFLEGIRHLETRAGIDFPSARPGQASSSNQAGAAEVVKRPPRTKASNTLAPRLPPTWQTDRLRGYAITERARPSQ